MPGPFPGMDPYFESTQHWPDFHHRFITHLAETIVPKVQPRYRTRIGESIYIVDPPDRQSYIPDVTIVRRPPQADTSTALLDASVVVEPTIFERSSEPIRQGYVEIVSRSSGEVVTVIEVISPTNKAAGEGRTQYLKKQQNVLRSSVNLVEIDLWSRGTPVTDVSPGSLIQLPDYRYLIAIYPGSDRDHVKVYSLSLSRPLPALHVPLHVQDRDVAVPLQPILDECYDRGRFADEFDYQLPPEAPLNAEESFWLDMILREKGLRNGGSVPTE